MGIREDEIILNLTLHVATSDQQEDGVVEPHPQMKEQVKSLLNFSDLPTVGEIRERASSLAEIARDEGVNSAMIGGAPYLMAELENALRIEGVQPLYAFSQRESMETTEPDGSVVKKNVFRHRGFVAK